MRSEEIIEKRDDKPTANGICNGAKADISAAPNHLHREKYRVINQVLYAKGQPGKLRRADVERVERVVAQMGKLEKGNTKADDHNAHQHTGHAPEGDMLFHNRTPVVLPGRTKVELMNKYAYNLLQQKCNMSTLKGQYRNLWLVIHSSLTCFWTKNRLLFVGKISKLLVYCGRFVYTNMYVLKLYALCIQADTRGKRTWTCPVRVQHHGSPRSRGK